MKGHEHKYIDGLIGDECNFCGQPRSMIEMSEQESKVLFKPEEIVKQIEKRKKIHVKCGGEIEFFQITGRTEILARCKKCGKEEWQEYYLHDPQI